MKLSPDEYEPGTQTPKWAVVVRTLQVGGGGGHGSSTDPPNTHT